ncbi:ubiquinone/menaquinone biosynthesis methyltransferase [Stieleria maiorica]|uniref:Ubiquinone/menaquinone biosynthesis methyltransferase n=1 Tax=Stieleria maiorica TaxID=2795974 RepID=A0A5B9MDN3_9BACT|nr:class I SAM-dependent methyltransferase [Stieleria maiorica]QEF97595.1 ubiquinone/menaquinone biosynthesis methyltransferase [Stieleria maiorica]
MDQSELSVRGYDRLAKVYRGLEFCLFGNSLYRARVALVDQLPVTGRALVLGDGTGQVLQQLCLTQPNCQITTVDQSEQMLRRQRRRVERVGASDRVMFVQTDARTFPVPTDKYDLLVAAFILDCFTESELADCLPRFLAGLRPQGMFYFVDFVWPKTRWRRRQAAAYQWLMHRFFRWQTGLPNRRLVDLECVLAGQNLVTLHSADRLHPMTSCRILKVGWDSGMSD